MGSAKDVVRGFYDAFNRGDLDSAVTFFTEDTEKIDLVAVRGGQRPAGRKGRVTPRLLRPAGVPDDARDDARPRLRPLSHIRKNVVVSLRAGPRSARSRPARCEAAASPRTSSVRGTGPASTSHMPH